MKKKSKNIKKSRETIIGTLLSMEISIPREILEGIDSEKVKKIATKHYTNTQIENASMMDRSLQRDEGKRAADIALLGIAKKLGVKDADLVSARISEKTHLLAELRGHDSLVRMILKIASAAGLYSVDEHKKKPTSTLEALQIGVILQHIFSKLFDKALNNNKAYEELKETVTALRAEKESVQDELTILRLQNNKLSELAESRAEIIEVTAKPYFNICLNATDPDADDEEIWLTWKSSESPVVYSPDVAIKPSSITLSKYNKKTARFYSHQEAKEFMEWILKRKLLKNIDYPEELRIVRFIAEDFGN